MCMVTQLSHELTRNRTASPNGGIEKLKNEGSVLLGDKTKLRWDGEKLFTENARASVQIMWLLEPCISLRVKIENELK